LKPFDEKGYLITALKNDHIDYLACARALAKSIRFWQPDSKICLLTNYEVIENNELFDYVKNYRYAIDENNPFANDWQIFFCSPFHETIKLESDIILTGSIDHWWTGMRHKDVLIATGCRNFYGEKSQERFYRRIFDYNNLPDVYNGITYWRLNEFSKQFFMQVRNIFENWEQYYKLLSGVDAEIVPDTDVVYAIASVMVGEKNVTLPSMDYPNFVHMKGKHNDFSGEEWTKHFVWELDAGQLRINTIAQQHPVHYHEKEFAHKLEEHYDQLLARA